MTSSLLQAIVLIAAFVIIFRAEPALNRMGRCAPFTMRVAFHLLTLGAIAEIAFVVIGDIPRWPSAIVTAGVAALLVCDRRLTVQRRMP